jgi:DNA-binding MarR family transcriptional regulator
LDFIRYYGAMLAGRPGELSDLTTAAVTGVIDRLEQTGYVGGEMIQKIDVEPL